MKTTLLLICLWLTSVATVAQKAPATIKVSPAEIYMTNSSAKEIIAYVLSYTSNNVGGTLSDDYYFHQGIGPAEAFDLKNTLPPEATSFTAAKLLFVQFADGSTWGTQRRARKCSRDGNCSAGF